MNFTREPIIETIITPKDGFRLTLRSSKGTSQEEYSVEALEVISFGNAQFFRSTEKPKSFLLPISDYEVVETREAKIVLKNPAIDRTIKIAGGKEPHMKMPVKEVHVEVSEASVDNADEEKEVSFEKRKDKKKNRRKKSLEMRNQEKEKEREVENKAEDKVASEVAQVKKTESSEELTNSTPIFAMLLPPPTTLISESLSRYKAMDSSENFMMPRVSEKEEKKEEVDLSAYVSSNEEELDQIWAHKQNEETFVSAETSVPEESAEIVEIQEESHAEELQKEEVKEEDKSIEMDISQFIE